MGLQRLYDTPSWEWPQGADELILRVLRDNSADQSDRLLAAEMAGDSVVVNDELADVLLSVLADGKAPDDKTLTRIRQEVLSHETALKWTEGKPPKRFIHVPNKIINVVV